MKGYGEKLRKLRGSRTQAEIAIAVGTSESAIAMYEREERVPRDRVKVALAEYFKTTVQAIFFEN